MKMMISLVLLMMVVFISCENIVTEPYEYDGGATYYISGTPGDTALVLYSSGCNNLITETVTLPWELRVDYVQYTALMSVYSASPVDLRIEYSSTWTELLNQTGYTYIDISDSFYY